MTIQNLNDRNALNAEHNVLFNAVGEKQQDWFYDPRWDNGITWYVDSNMSASGDGKSKMTAFKTLLEAVNAADDWDTIHICACTLNITSGITTSKNLKIEGEGRDRTIVKGTGSSSSTGYFIRFDASNSDARLEVRSMTIRDFVCSTYFVQGVCGPALCCNRSTLGKDVGNFKTRAEFEAVHCCFMLDCSIVSCRSAGSNNYYEGGSIANAMAMCSEFRSSSSYNSGTGKYSTFVNCIIRESHGNHNTIGDDSLYNCTLYNCQRGTSNLKIFDKANLALRNSIIYQDTSFAQTTINIKSFSHCALHGNFTYTTGRPGSSDFILSESPFSDIESLRLQQDSIIRGKTDPEFIWLERDVWGNAFDKSNAAIGAVQS